MTFATTFRRGDRVQHPAVGRGTFQRLSRCSGDAIVEWDDPAAPAGVRYDELRAAPVTVVGPVPPAPPSACPECGSPLMRDPEAIKFEAGPDGRARGKQVCVVACCGCEFIQEVPR